MRAKRDADKAAIRRLVTAWLKKHGIRDTIHVHEGRGLPGLSVIVSWDTFEQHGAALAEYIRRYLNKKFEYVRLGTPVRVAQGVPNRWEKIRMRWWTWPKGPKR